MDYTTDAHSLIWYFTENPRLSKKALKAFEQTKEEGSIIVPALVLAEVMFIARKGRTTLTFEQTLAKMEEYENFEAAPLDVNILKVADTIEVDLEMHDKLIVATALYLDIPLITRDEQIKQSGVVTTIW